MRVALSIQQPWAEAIVRSIKPVNNRSWFTAYRGPLLIHAGVKWDAAGERFIRDQVGHDEETDALLQRARERRSGIIGRARLVDCVIRHDSPWFVGKYGFVLEEAEAFGAVIPCRGRRQLFIVPADIRAAVPPLPGQAVAS